MKYIIFFLLLSVSAFAKDYFVSQTGSAQAMSVAAFNANTLLTGGDVVYFQGNITSPIIVPKSGSTSAQLILDGSGSILVPVSSNPAIAFNGRSYVTARGFAITAPSPASWPKNALIKFNGGNESVGCVVENISASGDGQNGTDLLIDIRWSSFITIQNNTAIGMASLGWFDGLSHDIMVKGNYFLTSTNQTVQTDVFSYGDGYNITIEGNKFINRAPGAISGRHNDVIQVYHSGANGGKNPSPYGLIIRYNWIETAGTSGSGDMSWTMLESFNNGPNGEAALKIYGNVFVGNKNSVANNGLSCGGNIGGNYYVYNNTFIAPGGRPGNTLAMGGSGGSNGVLYCVNNLGYDPIGGGGTYLNWTMKAGSPWNYNWFYQWNNPSVTYTGKNGASNTNPLLAANYAPLANSPLIGAGDSSLGAEYAQGIAPDAVWPNPRLMARGSKWDIGAYQTSGAVVPPVIPPIILPVIPPIAPNPKIISTVISADGKQVITTFDIPITH